MDALQYEIDALKPDNPDKFQRFFRQKRFDAIARELRQLRGKRTKHAKHAKRPRLLDIGCGPGILADRFRKMGFDVTGIDVNPRFVEYARKTFPEADFYNKSAEKPVKGLGRFDFIVMSEVIEHLRDPGAALRNIRRLLKPDGTAIITNPNYSGVAAVAEFLWSLRAEYDWIEEHSSEICAPPRMRSMLLSNGLEAERIYTIFYVSQFLPIISERLADRMFRREMRHLGERLRLGHLMVTVAKNRR